VVVIDKQPWVLGDRATYTSGDGEVEEWECKAGSDSGYLLREGRDAPRWFFTREAPAGSVAVPGGEVLTRWIARTASAEPPPALTFRGQTYRFAERVEGTYRASDQADSSGGDDATGKTTWEYWDSGHTYNLAVERWPDGTTECYHGRYVDASAVPVRSGRAAAATSAPWTPGGVAFLVFMATIVLIVLVAILDHVDLALSVTLGLVVGIWLLAAASRASAPGGTSLLAAPVMAWLFARFPPLTSLPGLAVVLVMPAAITRWAAMRDATIARSGRRVATATMMAAVLAAGLYHYFWFAPGPRTFEHYLIAIGPAPIAALIAAVISTLVIRMTD
jgi:hypothetical protein